MDAPEFFGAKPPQSDSETYVETIQIGNKAKHTGLTLDLGKASVPLKSTHFSNKVGLSSTKTEKVHLRKRNEELGVR